MNNQKILNLGCGEDWYGTHRMDIISRPNVNVLGSVDESLPFEDNYFDEVYAKQIFEHIPNPLSFLLECKRVLKKGGKLKLWTDNGNWVLFVYNRIKIVHGNYRYKGDKMDERDMHFQFFQPEHIRNYFWRAAFNRKTIKIELINYFDKRKQDTKESI